MRGWVVAALDLLFPALCPVCDAVLGRGRRDPLCGACWAALPRLGAPCCPVCGRPDPAFEPAAAPPLPCGACATEPPAYDWARAAARYDGPVREAVQALKFGGKRALARPLADLVREQWGDAVPPAAVLVPVPLAREREHERGFNQAALLVDRLAATLHLRAAARWLVRVRATPPQTELSARERRANVRGAFAAAPDAAGRDVVVVDDVLTTGATVSECARVLHAAGARRVGVLAVARVL